ncbi:hypothetical protein Bca52824_092083 [Brassica carinata]|uniref:KH type-2 domain-containing protein n=1 Tax=Brassica carinata TaxID=52824 RepID=A0A8X7NVJ5_BRACI|nr:hypothetical protein Bca52824_092083 [Brassica carinata]
MGAPGRRKSHAESKEAERLKLISKGCGLKTVGEKGRRIRELTSLVEKRFRFPQDSVELYVEKVANRDLCAIAQAASLRYKLLGGLAVCSC